MPNDQSKKRVKKLFSGIQLADSKPPNGNNDADGQPMAASSVSEVAHLSSPAILLQEVEALRARVLELETRLLESETRRSSAPIIYEKEELGFAYAGEQVTPIRGNQLQVQKEAELIRTPMVA